MAVRNGRWSSEFSLETAGTTGMIQCKDDNKTYNVIFKTNKCVGAFHIFSKLLSSSHLKKKSS